ncbi:hypothetical protein Tco_0534092, partial [Tanacetum coccineum]
SGVRYGAEAEDGAGDGAEARAYIMN